MNLLLWMVPSFAAPPIPTWTATAVEAVERAEEATSRLRRLRPPSLAPAMEPWDSCKDLPDLVRSLRGQLLCGLLEPVA
jgi:hypothetical protein